MPRLPSLPASTLLVALVLAGSGCTSLPPAQPGAPAGPTVPAAPTATEQRSSLAEALAVEQQWLQSFFQGTPVRVALQANGSLAVDVPLEFAFDAGGSRVKPPLAAVLDKVAESLRRRPAAHVRLLAAPDDKAGAAPLLALQRATQVQRHLRERGVPATRLAAPSAAGVTLVSLRIGIAPP